MTDQEIQVVIEKQRKYFATGATLPVAARKAALKKLYAAIDKYEDKLYEALKYDLGKSASESYMCEIGLTKSEISFMLKHVARYAREKRVLTPMAQYVSRSFEKPSPYGCVLIMSPWNYPFLLTIDPLADAIAAGNCVVVKPSAYSPATSAVMAEMLTETFEPEFVSVVTGGRAENTALIRAKFDYIFFTGSQAVGKEVMRCAAENLVPVTLELGGKSPCIIDETANIKLAAKRIAFGKYVNCGQTCVAPDYIYCHASVKDAFVEAIKAEIARQYGDDPLSNPNFGKIINAKHYQRLMGLIDQQKVVCGGKGDEATERIEPTVMDNVTWDDAVMGEEIFGPIMPIMTYTSLEEIVDIIRSKDEPLALYIFSSNKKNIEFVKSRVSFGGGCINDTLIHLATSAMGFGGVGGSGMGSYHGKHGFETFTHRKSMVDKKTFLDLPMRYQPYCSWKDFLVKMFVR